MPDRLLRRFEVPADALAYEIVQEQAAALGRLGRRLEQALANLRAFDTARTASGTASFTPAERGTRHALLAEAGHALWLFVVQREACGLRDSRSVMRDYAVPAEVQIRMGLLPPPPPGKRARAR